MFVLKCTKVYDGMSVSSLFFHVPLAFGGSDIGGHGSIVGCQCPLVANMANPAQVRVQDAKVAEIERCQRRRGRQATP